MIEIVASSSSTRPRQRVVGAARDEARRRPCPAGSPRPRPTTTSSTPRRSSTGVTVPARAVSVTSIRAPECEADRPHLLRGEAGVDRDQHAPGERDGEMGDEQRRGVRAEVGDPVARAQPRGPQRVGDARDLGGELAVGQAPVAVDDRGGAGEDVRRALEQRQRREGRDVDGHGVLSTRTRPAGQPGQRLRGEVGDALEHHVGEREVRRPRAGRSGSGSPRPASRRRRPRGCPAAESSTATASAGAAPSRSSARR